MSDYVIIFIRVNFFFERSLVESLSNKQMIEHLSRFRDAGDKLSEDIYNISMRIFDIISEAEARENKSEGEEALLSRLRGMSEIIMSSALDSNKYNDSMWKDYTRVIKSLGANSGEKING